MVTLTRAWIISTLLALVLTLGTLFVAQWIADRQVSEPERNAIAAAMRPSIEIVP